MVIPQHKEAERVLHSLIGADSTALDYAVLMLLKLLGWPGLSVQNAAFVTGLIRYYGWSFYRAFANSNQPWSGQSLAPRR